MRAKIINGKELQRQLLEEVKNEIMILGTHGIIPGLVTILVGNDPASLSYITSKQNIAKELGMHSVLEHLKEDISEQYLVDKIEKYNKDNSIHGILVQTPLPTQINELRIVSSINPQKDVDCFNPKNVGLLSMGSPNFLPCTPAGVQEMLIRSNIETEGKNIVVIGRSNIVGKPMASMMLQKTKFANSTVTVCHSTTKELKQHTLKADIIIVASGMPNTLTGDMILDGVVVIDVGINKIGEYSNGKAKLCGDVHFDSVALKASYISPVPGGVGPMTIGMLMKNTVKAANKIVYGS